MDVKIVGRRALIGRGFLGSVLDQPGRFTDRYHSKNIDQLHGSYDLIVVAAPHATKWWANGHPDLDFVGCNQIVQALASTDSKPSGTAQGGRKVLFSTIDAGREASGAYGSHRLWMESWMPRNTAIVRLPALYGDGLRKNALFDLLEGRPIANQVYHWYNVKHLWSAVRQAKPGVQVQYSAPLSMWEIAEALGLTHLVTLPHDPKKDYNEPGPYTMTSEEVLADVVAWGKIQQEKQSQSR